MLKNLRHHVPRLLENSTVLALLGLLLLCIAMTLMSDRFATWSNLENVARQVSINAIIAAGMTVVILSGGIDLSVGSVMALSMTLSSWAMLQDMPIGVAVLLGLATGLVFGAFNGVVIAYGRLPAIIVTLATMEMPTRFGAAADRWLSPIGIARRIFMDWPGRSTRHPDADGDHVARLRRVVVAIDVGSTQCRDRFRTGRNRRRRSRRDGDHGRSWLDHWNVDRCDDARRAQQRFEFDERVAVHSKGAQRGHHFASHLRRNIETRSLIIQNDPTCFA